MRMTLWSYVSGLLIGAGIVVSGMVDPANVQGFLDVAGAWNPSLAVVMAAGLAVAGIGYRLCLKRPAPLCAEAWQLPANRDIDRRLLGGSAVFGLGWGLAGYCPGPALIASAGGAVEAVAFTLAMVAGMVAWRLVETGARRRAGQAA
ncbi:MAG: DUF6691 family protein [Solirubrobacterales bacterium]